MTSTSRAIPAVTEHVYETDDGAELFWEELGEGPRVLLVHGGTGTGAYDWEYVREPLAESHRLMVLDMRGHGRSSDPRKLVSLAQVGADIRSLLRAQGGGCDAIIAFSIGASATLALLCEEPGLTRAFVAIGASRMGDPSRVEEFSTGPWPSALQALRHEHGTGDDYWKQLRSAFATSWADLHLDDAALANLTLPTLAVCGDRDRIEPVETALALTRTVPQGQLLVLPDCGHFVPRQRPAELTVAVRGFLDRVL
jgi:pimeloyl-ACP methyl ester carboxylesterase